MRGEPRLQLVANLGVNGYSSDDLIRFELPALDDLRPDFVTLQIGVNDVVRGVPESVYADNLTEILNALFAVLPPERVLCVATPDYTVTPQGGTFGSAEQQRAGIERVNGLMEAALWRARGSLRARHLRDLQGGRHRPVTRGARRAASFRGSIRAVGRGDPAGGR